MSEADYFWTTIQHTAGLFAGGAMLILILARFDIQRIVRGELGARYMGWLILTPIYALVLFTNTIVGALVILLGMIFSTIEYSHAARIRQAEQVFLYICAGITLVTVLFKPALFAALPVAVLFVLTAIPILQNNVSRLHGRVRLISWGYIYTIWTLAHAILMFNYPDGKGILLIVIVGCALADIGAYVVGKAIGRTIIAPEINPQKAWEGIVGDLLGATIAVIVFGYIIPFYGWPFRIGMIIIIGLGSSWGDILSSMAKRSADIKDWGSTIPGHGGILDRLNSLIVVLPLMYYYLVVFLAA